MRYISHEIQVLFAGHLLVKLMRESMAVDPAPNQMALSFQGRKVSEAASEQAWILFSQSLSAFGEFE